MEYINELISGGSNFTKEQLKCFKEKLNYYKNIKYEKSKEIIIDQLINDINNFTQYGNVSDISTSLVFNNNYLNLYNTSLNQTFDVASITKLFTLLLTLKLSELDLINLNDNITDIDDKYINLNNYKIIDIINMKDELVTNNRLENSNNISKDLYETYIKEVDYKYTDIGFIILSNLIEKKLNMKYEDVLYKYLIKDNNLSYTKYDYKNVNDPKANKIGVIGSAGIKTNNEDLYLLYNNLHNYLNKESIEMLTKNSNKYPKMGPLYQKHTNIARTYVTPLYSDKTFASQGFTGCITVSDLYNKLHTSILVDAINKETKIKDKCYSKYFDIYQDEIIINMLILDYLSKYNDEKDSKKLIKI